MITDQPAGDEWEVEWDDDVDIVCVGPGRAALAAAVGAAAAGFDVLFVAGRAELSDTAADFLAAVTADMEGMAPPPESTPLPIRSRADAGWPALPKYVSFSGPALYDWATACLASPGGLLCTAAAAGDAGPLRVGEVDPAGAADLDGWLAERAAVLDIRPEEQSELRDLVVLGGTVSGVVLTGPHGETLVRAGIGVVMSTGADTALPSPGVDGAAELVVRGHPYSRFARLELLVD